MCATTPCGSDYDRMLSPREVQLDCLRAQCELAVDLGMPLFAHVREHGAAYRGERPALGAYAEFLAVISGARLDPLKVVVHCFTGDASDLNALVSAGVCIGVTGFIGIAKRAASTKAALADVGHQLLREHRLLLETDAPFML